MKSWDEIPERAKPPTSVHSKVRGCDSAPRFADLIEASGHAPPSQAVHMNAPSSWMKSIAKPLAPRAVPHMRLYRPEDGPVIAMGSDLGSAYQGEIRCHSNEQLTKILM